MRKSCHIAWLLGLAALGDAYYQSEENYEDFEENSENEVFSLTDMVNNFQVRVENIG